MYSYNDGQHLEPPSAAVILKSLRTGHPRLILDAAVIERVRGTIQADPTAAAVYEEIKRKAAGLLETSPSSYRIRDGKRLLDTSKRVLERVQVLGLVCLLENEGIYADRAWKELEAAAAFPDWNPKHFLDTAEMTHAFAIGYDWLYERWSEEQRHALRNAIVRLGLLPGIERYEKGSEHWITGTNNWNQVCNGGLAIGALAIAESEPELAGRVLHEAIKNLPRALGSYAPDGASVEGIHYWNYGAWYSVVALSAMESALGTDFGLSGTEGFREGGDFHVFMSGPDGQGFNFSDSWAMRTSTPQHFWMGTTFGIPYYSWFRYRELMRPGHKAEVLDLIWFEAGAKDFDPATLQLDMHFRGTECASMRSTWGDPDALALGIQAGRNRNLQMHRQLDLGSFILDALGERWAIDCGNDMAIYRLHNSHARKWEIYRVRAEGNNTLVMNPGPGPDQNADGTASIIRFSSEPDRASAVIDMSEAYADHAELTRRTFELERQSHVVITDEILAKQPADVWWFMHTEADVDLQEDGRKAILSQNGTQLTAEILEPADGGFAVLAAEPLPTSPNPEGQTDNDDRRKLAIRLNGVRDARIVVRLTPKR